MVKRVLGPLLVLVALCAGEQGAAQPLEPQLIPIDSSLAAFGSLRPYQQAVREHLLGRAAGPSVLVFPSFEKEWAVQLGHDRGVPFVLYAVVDDSLWASLQERVERDKVLDGRILRDLRVPVTRHTAVLAQGTAAAAERAWEVMLSSARQPAERRRIIDGTSYVFLGATPGPRRLVGAARSPQEGTPVGALADLVNALRAHATAAHPEQRASETEVLRRAETVLAAAQAWPSSR